MELAAPCVQPNTKTFWLQPYDNDHKRVDILKIWVRDRVRYPEIASRLKTTVGAVCGKVNRLGIGQGAPADRQRSRTRRPPSQPPDLDFYRIMRKQAAEAIHRQGDTVALADLEDHHCRFVIGEPAHGAYCGKTRAMGTAYCQEHGTRIFEPVAASPQAACGHAQGVARERTAA